MEERLAQLERRIESLERENQALRNVATFPLDIQRVLEKRGFFRLTSPLGTGVLYSTNGVISTVVGDTETVYVALISGGSPTNPMAVSNGIVTAI